MDGVAQEKWQAAASYVDLLQSNTGEDVCIAMALIDGDQVQQHFSGDCDNRSLFQIGSITKTFTGVLLADAVLDGGLMLSTTIDELIDSPVPAAQGRPITVLDLATHRSGLPQLPANLVLDEDSARDPYLDYGERELLAFLAGHELQRAPEAVVEYSNLGFGLLGFLLAHRAEMTYAELVRQTITEPLGMSDTVVSPDVDQRARATAAHSSDGSEVPHWGFDSLAGAGALYSTLADMVVYLQANLAAPDGAIGKRLAMAATPQRQATELGGSIGFGWINWENDGERGVWHNGGTAGHRSFAGFLPGSNRGAIVLANASLEEVDGIGAYLLGAAESLPLPVTTEGGQFAEYLGSYRFSPDFTIQITAAGDSLFGQATGQPRFSMSELEGDRYKVEGVDAKIEFNRAETEDSLGKIVSLTLFQNGAEPVAMKEGVELEP